MPKPQRSAISSIVASVDSSAARAASTRWASSQRRTGTPVSAVKRRAKVRSETWAWAASVRTVRGSCEALERPGAGGGERAARVRRGAAARRTGPGRPRGGVGRRGGGRSWLASAAPWSRRRMCRHRSRPDATPARGQDVALVDVEHVGLDVDARVARGEVGGVAPVGRGAAAVEDAGGGERERAGADRGHARAALVGGAQRRRAPAPAGRAGAA